MEVKIDRLDHQGRGIAILDKVTFIPNALPGEIVDIEIVESKSKYNIGEIKKYIKKSEKRVNPVCPYYDLCGGCDLMHMSYYDEARYKEDKIKNIMQRYAGLTNVSPIIRSTSELGYRNKVTFKVDKKLGLYKEDTHDIIYINDCKLISDQMNSYIDVINKMDLTGVYEVVIRESNNADMIIFKCNEDVKLDVEGIEANVVRYYDRKYKTLKGNDYIIDKVGDLKYKISPSSFFQVNRDQVKKLYDLVLENLNLNKNDKVLDLYCGTGTIGLYVARYCSDVFGIEINEDAIKDANYNKKINDIDNIFFTAGDSKIIKDISYKPNKIIVDPPRAGLDPKVIDEIININPETLIYVSCDPITLARDLNIFKNNYTVEKIIPVDMFPRTYHIESLLVLEKKDV